MEDIELLNKIRRRIDYTSLYAQVRNTVNNIINWDLNYVCEVDENEFVSTVCDEVKNGIFDYFEIDSFDYPKMSDKLYVHIYDIFRNYLKGVYKEEREKRCNEEDD